MAAASASVEPERRKLGLGSIFMNHEYKVRWADYCYKSYSALTVDRVSLHKAGEWLNIST